MVLRCNRRVLVEGHVVKVVLRFREPFWESLTVPGEDEEPADLKKLTFVHAPVEVLPTWCPRGYRYRITRLT